MNVAQRAQYLMIGGFLGAGKTTAILKLAAYLKARGRRVGLITNDQSINLVDTARARSAGHAVEEITGGCFCCKFKSLVEASQVLTRQTAPDVLIAEPVGSCTDLQATVAYPLRQLYGEVYRVAPLSVLLDPQRCGRVLGVLADGKNFSEKVLYVYRKQLEEAELLVLNKVDQIDANLRARLVAALREKYPAADVLEISAATGEGSQAWFDRLLASELGTRELIDIDYDTYAEGEALLGWLNARALIRTAAEFDGNALVMTLTTNLRNRLAERGVEIAHLKMMLSPDEGPDMAAIGLTRTEERPQPTHQLTAPLTSGTLVINLRAEADPDLLEAQVLAGVAELLPGQAEVKEIAAFRPGRPSPTHRGDASEACSGSSCDCRRRPTTA